MSRRIQTTFTRPPAHVICCMGDSLTDNEGAKGVPPNLMWPEMVALRLRNAGASVKARNFGVSGQRSNHMINRADQIFLYDILPDVAMMWTGTNDTPSPTWAGSGGSIVATANQYVGVVVVFHCSVGIDLVCQPVAVQTTNTSAGEITIGVITGVPTNESSYDIYTTTQTFSTALAAISAGAANYKLATSSAAVSGGNITATTATSLGSTTVLNTVQGVTAFTTGQCLQAFCRAVKFLCKGTSPYTIPTQGVAVKNQAQLPAGNYIGSRMVVMNDTSTTGGQAATQGGQHATIAGTAAGMTVWEWRYSYSGETGWGRVAIGSTPAFNSSTKIFIPLMHYLNYSAGGDTVGTPFQPFDDVSGIRSQQIAAVNAEAALDGGQTAYVDIYAFLKARIGIAPDTQGSFSWHVADQDPHRNAYGEDLIAIKVTTDVVATSGLLTSLSS